MVSYRSPDGKQSYHQTDELADAMQFVEHLRNAESVEHARIFKMEELSFEYRPYYRVELATAPPPPPPTTSDDWMAAAPQVSEDDEPDVDPLAAAWSASERVEPEETESVGAGVGHGFGAGLGRKGLFGR